MFLHYAIDMSLLEARGRIWFKDMHLGVTLNLDCQLDWIKKDLGN